MSDERGELSKELLAQFQDQISGLTTEQLHELTKDLLGRASDRFQRRVAPPSRRRPRRAEPLTYRLRVDLEDATPPIWRRLDVRSDTGLETLHQVLQAAFGWTDSHLHRFALGESVFDLNAEMFLCPYEVEEGDHGGVPAREVHLDETLAEPGDVLRYCYDYGDSWDLDIVLESVQPLDPDLLTAVCLAGKRAAPPEDCGGLRTADQLAEVLLDPGHVDLEEVNQAIADPVVSLGDSGVKPELVNLLTRLRDSGVGDELVTRVMSLLDAFVPRSAPSERGKALQPILWFLDHVGDEGLPLTSAGYLKPADVEAAVPRIPGGPEWYGKKTREVDTMPVLLFRQLLQELGLLRKYRGRLVLTKAGARLRGTPDALWDHVAGRLPLGRPGSAELHAGQLALVWSASSPGGSVPMGRLTAALDALGWRQGTEPVDDFTAEWAISGTLGVFRALATEPGTYLRSYDKISPVAADLARDAILLRSG